MSATFHSYKNKCRQLYSPAKIRVGNFLDFIFGQRATLNVGQVKCPRLLMLNIGLFIIWLVWLFGMLNFSSLLIL